MTTCERCTELELENQRLALEVMRLKKRIETLAETHTSEHKFGEECNEILKYMNLVAGTGYTTKNKTTTSYINARLSEGFVVRDFVTVINHKWKQWGSDPKMSQYFRPQTLFCAKNFEGYLNAARIAPSIKATSYQPGIAAFLEKASQSIPDIEH